MITFGLRIFDRRLKLELDPSRKATDGTSSRGLDSVIIDGENRIFIYSNRIGDERASFGSTRQVPHCVTYQTSKIFTTKVAAVNSFLIRWV